MNQKDTRKQKSKSASALDRSNSIMFVPSRWSYSRQLVSLAHQNKTNKNKTYSRLLVPMWLASDLSGLFLGPESRFIHCNHWHCFWKDKLPLDFLSFFFNVSSTTNETPFTTIVLFLHWQKNVIFLWFGWTLLYEWNLKPVLLLDICLLLPSERSSSLCDLWTGWKAFVEVVKKHLSLIFFRILLSYWINAKKSSVHKGWWVVFFLFFLGIRPPAEICIVLPFLYSQD